MHIIWQGGGGGAVCLALTLVLSAFLCPVNREASRVEGCTYKRRATPKGKGPSPFSSEWMSSTRDLCQLFILLCPSGWFDLRPGFTFIIKLRGRV